MDDICIVGSVQTWAEAEGPSCYQEALLVRNSASSQLYRAALQHSWGLRVLICMLCQGGPYSSRSSLFWPLAIICAHECLQWALSLILSSGHGWLLPHQLFSIAEKGLQAWKAELTVEGLRFKFYLSHLLTVRSWTSHFPFLNPEFAPLFNYDNGHLKQCSKNSM